MSVKDHYDRHLGNFYAWMTGDFHTNRQKFEHFLHREQIKPFFNKKALDLGAGHGIQTAALANIGFEVTAIDFNAQLLKDLHRNCAGMPVKIIADDIRNLLQFNSIQPELILCWGDTLTHLESTKEVEKFLIDCSQIAAPNGKLMLSFRDYTKKLTGHQRFIPVKSDDTRILTCFLEYFKDTVAVTDFLYEKEGSEWVHKVSSYRKVIIDSTELVEFLQAMGWQLLFQNKLNGIITLIAEQSSE